MPNVENPGENVDYHLKWIVKGGFFVFLGVVLSKILLYTYRVIIARNYGVEDYGLFSIAIMITGFFFFNIFIRII